MDWREEKAIEYIKDNLSLIDSNNFTEFYDNLFKGSRADVTSLLLEADINPLLYMDTVPRSYLLNQEDIKSIAISGNIKSIGDDAFANCTSLTNIIIPNSVTSIGGGAFEDCRSLETINYKGSKEQWNLINKGPKWKYNSSIKTIHCTDGDIKIMKLKP